MDNIQKAFKNKGLRGAAGAAWDATADAAKSAYNGLRGGQVAAPAAPAAPKIDPKVSAGGFTNAERTAAAAKANAAGSPRTLPTAPSGPAQYQPSKWNGPVNPTTQGRIDAFANRPAPVAPASPVAGGIAQPPGKAMSRLTTAVKGGGVLAGMDQLGRGVAGIMEPGDSSAADKIRAGVGAASFTPGLAPGARAVAGGMSLANMVPDSWYEKGLGALGLMPEKSSIGTPETEAYTAAHPFQKTTAQPTTSPVPAQETQVGRAAPAPAALPPPDYGNDRGTGFLINHQTGKRTNIDSRAEIVRGLGAGAWREAAPQGGMTQELAGRARQYNTDADALMSKQGGGIGEAFVARGMRNSANGLNTQAMTSQGLDDARENQQLKREGDERVGLAKARADMAKAQQDQANSDRTFGLAQRAAGREDSKLLRARQERALADAGIRRLDENGDVTPEYQQFATGVQAEFLKFAGENGPIPTLDDLSEGDQQILIRASQDKKAIEPKTLERIYLKYIKQTPYTPTEGLTRGAPQAGTYDEGFLYDTVRDGNGTPLAVPGSGLTAEQQQRMRRGQ